MLLLTTTIEFRRILRWVLQKRRKKKEERTRKKLHRSWPLVLDGAGVLRDLVNRRRHLYELINIIQMVTCVRSALILTGFVVATEVSGVVDENLRAQLQEIVSEGSRIDNTSYSFAVAFGSASDDEIIHVFAGSDDRRVAGSEIDEMSLFPVGSVAKPWTALIALRLADPKLPVRPGGFLLDMDAPMLPIVDKWLGDQGQETASEIWRRDPAVTPSNMTALGNITTRMLLSMQGCIDDYNNSYMESWTETYPDKDILPHTFLTNVSHIIFCTPGEGGAYSGVSYVLAGMVISAAAGASRWEELHQMDLFRDLLRPEQAGLFNRTLFMGAGRCSQYPRMVHQYANTLPSPEFEAPFAYNHDVEDVMCRGEPTFKGIVVGHRKGLERVATLADCCEYITRRMVKEHHYKYAWTWIPPIKTATNGTCSLFSSYEGTEADNRSTSGFMTPPPPRPGDFTDLYNASCLNGWTMGNIATSPFDIAQFYQLLMQDRLVSHEMLEQMMQWHSMNEGRWRPATFQYGMGLINKSSSLRLIDGSRANWTGSIGHLGLDWGSGMSHIVGFYPALNVSMALATSRYVSFSISRACLTHSAQTK